MGFSITKFVGGFAFWKGEVIGKILYFLIIIAICLGVFWKLFIAKTNNTDQKAETIINNTEQPKKGFSVIRIGILGWGD